MGKSKRKNASPLVNDVAKNRRTGEEDKDGVEPLIENSSAQSGSDDATIADLKQFIRRENQESRKSIAEEIKRHNEERIAALENSLSFALTVNETLSKRLTEVEKRAERAEQDFLHCARRICTMEEELDSMHQTRLLDWLIFSGPAIPRRPRGGREDTPQMLAAMLEELMEFQVDMSQICEVHREERMLRVRFTSSKPGSDRDILFRNKTRLRGTGLYIRESLTPRRQAVYSELVARKMERKITTVFTRSGTVFAVVNSGERPRPVRSDEALQRLLSLLKGASTTASAVEPPSTDVPRATDEGEPTHQPVNLTSPASRVAEMRTPSSSGSRMDTDALREDHLVAEQLTRASGGARVRSPPSEGTPGRTEADASVPPDSRPDSIEAGGDRPSRSDPRPVTQERAGGGRDVSRGPERLPAARMDRRLGGGTSASLRRRQGADIRQFLGAVPREHSKRD